MEMKNNVKKTPNNTDGFGVTEQPTIKIFNSAGCSIEGISPDELPKFQKVGWMTEKEYNERGIN